MGTSSAGDPQAGGKGEQVARQRASSWRDAADDRQVDQREADDAEQQGQGRRDGVADDHLDVPQLVAQDGVGEGERHQGERQHGDRGQERRPRQAEQRSGAT